VTDIFINQPGEVWVDSLGGRIERFSEPDLTLERLWRLARQVASASSQGVSPQHPLLASAPPDGARVQIVAPPATRGGFAVAIRRHLASALPLEDYRASRVRDVFGNSLTRRSAANRDQRHGPSDAAPEKKSHSPVH
jgi:type IV secretion system protein VirB11